MSRLPPYIDEIIGLKQWGLHTTAQPLTIYSTLNKYFGVKNGKAVGQ
jgi:hypothetical protein